MNEFTNVNSIRITMRPPRFPAKLCLTTKVHIADSDHYEGFILDNNNPSDDF